MSLFWFLKMWILKMHVENVTKTNLLNWNIHITVTVTLFYSYQTLFRNLTQKGYKKSMFWFKINQNNQLVLFIINYHVLHFQLAN